MIHLVVLFAATSILIIFLATKQRKPFDQFCTAAVVLFCVLAVTSASLLHGTDMFPVSAFALAFLILMHHYIVRFPTDLTDADEGADMCMTAVRETMNHGTWAVAAFVAGTVSAFAM